MIAELEYLKLSVRKDRKLFVALPAVLACTLLLSLLGLEHGETLNAAHGILAFWALLGLPVLGAVLGGSGGAEARADAELESPLPLSAARRSLGRLAATVACLTVFAVVIGILSFGLPGGENITYPRAGDLSKCLIYSTYALGSAFAIGYACESSAIGALGGLLGTLFMTVLFGELVLMEVIFPGRGPFASTVAGLIAASLAAASASVALTARLRVWRRVSNAAHAAAQLALAAGLVLAVLLLADRYVQRFWIRPELFEGFMGSLTPAPVGSKFALEVRQRAPSGGVYVSALDGHVIWISPQHAILVVPPRRKLGLLKTLQNLPNAGGGDMFFASDGEVWLLRSDGTGGSEVWRGRVGEAMSRAAAIPEGVWPEALVQTAEGMSVLTSDGRIAALAPGKALEWKSAPRKVTGWSWRLIAGAVLPDGTAAAVWQDLDGLHRGEGSIKVRRPDGTLVTRGTVRIEAGTPWPQLVRLDERHAWYVEGYRLTERDLRGKLLESWTLPEWPLEGKWRFKTPYRAADEGLYVRTPGKLTLVGWDGRVKGSFKL